jgi:alpha-1,6-mannosyltransferase
MFVYAAVVFRSEVALLLATNVLYLILLPALSLERVIFPFCVSFLTALATSVPIDSYFWQRPLWPELWAFYYNVVKGSASQWGVSPWYYYFVSALPRLLVNPLTYTVLIPLALRHPALQPAAARLVVPSLLFIAVYSLQPHKETRFIFYAVPPLTAAAALGADLLFRRRRGKGVVAALAAALLVASVLASFAASSAMLAISTLNYPGGEALAYVRESVLSAEVPVAAAVGGADGGVGDSSGALVFVHADVLACMTGVTLFGTATANAAASVAAVPLSGSRDGGLVNQRRAGGRDSEVVIVVDKTEDQVELARLDFWRQFNYVLVEKPEKVRGMRGEWETVGVAKGYAGIEVARPGDKDEESAAPVVGSGKTVALWKRRVRALTGGWWVGPRMAERIYILRRAKGAARRMTAVEAR